MRSRFVGSTTTQRALGELRKPWRNLWTLRLFKSTRNWVRSLRPKISVIPKLEDGEGRTDLIMLDLNIPKEGRERKSAGRRFQ